MDFLQTKILEYLRVEPLTKMELSRKTEFHRKTVVKALNGLIWWGFVKSEFGTKEQGHYKRNEKFFITTN